VAALRIVPDGVDVADSYRRGVDHVAALDPEARRAYPLYALALGAIVLDAPGNERHRAARDRMLAELRRRQRDDGGWGYDAADSNLSATVVAIGALVLAGVATADPALVAARGFVEGCQNDDGGFFFSPTLADANKAGADAPGRYRSYGSMTADGVRALIRLGAPLDDPRVAAAAAWLRARFDPARNPGEFAAGDEVRRESAYYYWAWTSAHALRALGADPAWGRALAAELLTRQGADGSWRNRFTEMREDDPVIATSFALAALAVARHAIAGEYRSHAYERLGSDRDR
jgi:prenyltransferase beta subunit